MSSSELNAVNAYLKKQPDFLCRSCRKFKLRIGAKIKMGTRMLCCADCLEAIAKIKKDKVARGAN